MPTKSIVRSLSVVMPCYNELNTVLLCVEAVLKSEYVAELVIVDDGSNDGTRDQLAGISDPRVKVILHEKNGGKGAALQTGFTHAKFDYVIVQDADLEYDPEDYGRILAPLIAGKADVVFGSRFQGSDAHRVFFSGIR